jgi:glycosyltransferase involved in cell wall biosynthesis
LRLTLLANSPWAPTGYGQQNALLAPRLNNAGHPLAVISTYGHQGTPINWNGVQVFGSSYHPYALDVIYGHSMTFKADALVTLIDLQVFDTAALMGLKWLPWFPVDHVTIPPAIMYNVKQAFHPITMSKHASGEMDKAGLEYSYAPCAIDTTIFKPQPMAESREELKFPADKFMVGMVAMNKGNPSRKAFHQNIAAFAALQKMYGDCVMYLHTMDGTRIPTETENLVEYCKALGLSYGYAFKDDCSNVDVIFADQYGMAIGYTPDMMAKIYSSLDVHCGVTRGEGFGIPIIEAQACGCPVIVGDWSSMPELVFSGWKVPKEDADPCFTPLNAFQYIPRVAGIADKLNKAYQMRGNQDYRHRAVAGVDSYDIEKVIQKHWLPTLDKIQAKMDATPKADNLTQNLNVLR